MSQGRENGTEDKNERADSTKTICSLWTVSLRQKQLTVKCGLP